MSQQSFGQPAPGPWDQGAPGGPGGYQPAPGPGWGPPAHVSVGRIRPTGTTILLFLVTLGIYGFFWYYAVHEEMKRHKGTGLGGGVAVLLTVFVGVVMPFITSSEVGELYERRGQPKPVSGATGLWSFPGALIVVGPLVWFVKTNGALNDYWRSLGAV